MLRRMLVVAVVLLATPASAHAATVTNIGETLFYTADPAKTNVIRFSEGAQGVTVTRSGTDDDPIDATGCTELAPGTSYRCAGVKTVIVKTLDRDDVLDASGMTQTGVALTAGDGDDVLIGGAASDFLGGGNGIDRVEYAGTPLTITLDDQGDDGRPGERDTIASDVEDVVADPGPTGTATITGSDAGNRLELRDGSGTITGGPGFDELLGGPGGDTIDARDGYGDRVRCGAGTDTVKADQLDQVASDCENVAREPVVGGADDRPPAITWTAPAAGASISADKPTTLTATATDDRGVAKVQFLDDDRLVCEDTTAPYTCEYAARGGDVGRDTLIARAVDTADQASSAVQAVTVRRFSARKLTLKLNPSRDTRAPYRFRVTGNLTLPPAVSRTQGCQGSEVSIIVRAGGKIVATRRLTLSRVCGYQRRIDFSSRPGTRPRFTAKFLGNDVMQPISAPSKTGRTT